jgi:putative hemolysin
VKKQGEKMKKGMTILTASLIMVAALAACAAPRVQSSEPAATDMPQANMPNPASVYCEQNGNQLEIRTAADGSQSGVCIFPDGSTCDEWAYFRGECGQAAQDSLTQAATGEAISDASGGGPGGSGGAGENGSGGYMPPAASEGLSDWWGVIGSTPSGAQFDDYFERQDLGQPFIYFGINSLDPTVESQIETLRDSGKIVHLYGTLFSNVPDYNGSQVQVDRIEVIDGTGGYMPPGTSEEIADWWGVIRANPGGAQFDDYFERQDLGQVILFGIDSLDPTVESQIVALRDSGKVVHLYGTLLSNFPDVNGSQIQVDRIEY